ncbi:MAG: exonuclease SbcCD subunit D [archaeon]
MKFAHLGDCHLGGWRQPELKELNLDSFKYAVDKCISEKVEFVIIAGDLFDTSYPPIDILKDTFNEFRKLHEHKIPVFLIAGSHDYSASGKTFLDVLEKSGFCRNISLFHEKDGKIVLQPTVYNKTVFYGYPGKKSGLEVDDIERIKLDDAPGFFKILVLHTALRDAIGRLPIKAVDHNFLPKVDYLALGHLHINYCKENRVYSGPTFPNNLSELEELQGGSFYIYADGRITRESIKLKQLVIIDKEVKNALSTTDELLLELEKHNLKDKILILKMYGIIEKGKSADIDFKKIEDYAKANGAYTVIKSITKLHLQDSEVKSDFLDSANLEAMIIKRFEETNPSPFNNLIPQLMKSLQIEKADEERLNIFEERLVSEIMKVLEK